MGAEGKVVLKGLGRPPVEEDGTSVVFDAEGLSCCCDDVAPTHCKNIKWNLTSPPDALYPSSVNSEVAICWTWTLNGGPFAGTYDVSNIYYGEGSYGERRTIVAQSNFSAPLFDPVNKTLRGTYPIWAGFEYEVQFTLSLQEDGEFRSVAMKILNLSIPQPVYDGGFIANRIPKRIPFVVSYAELNWFDQRSHLIDFTPTGDNASYVTDWDFTLDVTKSTRSVRGGSNNNCGCEWTHPRYINHPQLINASASDGWSREYSVDYSNVDGDGVAVTPQPLECDNFEGHIGWSLETGTGQFSAFKPKGVYDPYGDSVGTQFGFKHLNIQKRVPWELNDNFQWDITLQTAAFSRLTTADPVAAPFGGYLGGGYDIRCPWLPNGLTINRRFEISNVFDATYTGEMLSYYTIPPYAALAHTATPPSTLGILIPWDKVLPDTTVISIRVTDMKTKLYGPHAGPLSSAVGVGGVEGLEYTITLLINDIVVYSDILIKSGRDIYGNDPWVDGEFGCWAQVSAWPWINNFQRPEVFTQFAGGFDDECKDSLSSSMTIEKPSYAAPEHCVRGNPDIILTTAGDLNLEEGTHKITFHVGEDIGTYAPPATMIHQAHERASILMKQPMYIYRTRFEPEDSGMPSGLSCTAAGLMTGTPTTEGVTVVQHYFRDAEGFEKCSWPLEITVKVRDPDLPY